MQTIRYNIVEKIVDVPLLHEKYRGFMVGGYKTNFSTWIAEHAIIYKPSLDALKDSPLVRINSACFTGDIFGDRRCDCTEQLFRAMELIDSQGGLVIYHLHHEGRGLGFVSKLATYKLMEENGVSTFEASKALSNVMDLRTYGSAILILHDLGIKRLKLITNNPNKKFILEQNGILVESVVGLVVDRPDIRRYLLSKREEQGHFIDFQVQDTTKSK